MFFKLSARNITYVALAIVVIVLVVAAATKSHRLHFFKTFWISRNDGLPPPPPSREEIVELNGCITLDVSGDSDRFLGCVKDSLNKEHIPYMENRGQAATPLLQALQNLNSCKNDKKAMVIGHGQPGFIHVNGGDFYIGDRISAIADLQDGGPGDQPWNESEWVEFVNKNLRNHFEQITLLGCDTGKQQNGNKVLMKMAIESNASVTAPKGKVWCDPRRKKVLIDKTDGWSTVLSGGVVSEKKQEEVARFEYSSEIGETSARSALLNLLLSSSDVTVRLCLRSTPSHKFAMDPLCQALSPEKIKNLVAAIFNFKAPFATSYISGADRTGVITISSATLNKSIQLDILNDDLVGEATTGTYYHVSDKQSTSWQILMK